MSERKTVSVEDLRRAVQALGVDGREISYPLIYEFLGLENEAEKDVARARMNSMVKHGEVTRTERGSFIYNFKRRARKSAGFESIWRFVRAAKPNWSIEDCSLMTRMSYSHVCKYVNWLESEGFVERLGRNKNNQFGFRNTSKARSTPETPYPPVRETDPFAKERVAAATITRLMLCANPYAAKTARSISEACHTLLAKFEKISAETRMENENDEVNHVE